jgi:hypothetical protein
LWDDRLWMVELKTEQASHRPTQLPAYFELAAHHCPNVQIDLTYLSPAMPLVPPPVPAGMRFAHVSWHEVTLLVAEVWGNSDQPEPDVASKLLAALASIGGSWATWRPAQLTAAGRALPAPALARPAADRPDLLRAVLALAAATAHDGRQRAVDHPAADLEELQQLRLDRGRAPGRTGRSCRWPKCRPGNLRGGESGDRRSPRPVPGRSGLGGGGGGPPEPGSPSAASGRGPAGAELAAGNRGGGLARRPRRAARAAVLGWSAVDRAYL